MLDSDEDSFEDQVDDSNDSGENNAVEISTSSPSITSTPVISSTLMPTKIPLDTSWKKNGIEDRALRAVASLGDYCISFYYLQNKSQFFI